MNIETISSGKIVAFFEQKELISAVCLAEKNRRLHLLRQDGKEVKLGINRVIHASSDSIELKGPAEKILQELRQRTQRRKELAKQVCVPELWEALDGNGHLFEVGILAGTVFGEGSGSDHEAAVIRALMQDRVYFKLRGCRFLSHTPEQIEKIKIKTEKDKQRREEIEGAIAWLRSVTSGNERQCKNRSEFIALLKDFVVFDKEAPNYGKSKEILKEVGVFEQAACFDILVKLGVWDEDENLLLQRYNLSYVWPGPALEQTDRLVKAACLQPVSHKGREDLTALQAFTIDEPSTSDIDDAVSFDFRDGFLQLGIHITDVASFIPPGSPLDKEASRRGTSLYLPEGKVSMIPPAVSENLLSLNEGRQRPAVSLIIKLTPGGDILDFKAVLSIIKIAGKLSYNEVDAAIEKGSAFSQLYEFACRRREKRIEAGAGGTLIPELQVMVDAQKEVCVKIRTKESPGQLLVAECMILANYCAALLLKEKGVPALYRKQAAPAKKIEPQKNPSFFHLFCLRRNFSRMEVDVVPGPHSSLGLSSYTSLTSPLRKYFDLVTQRQLVSNLRGEVPVYGNKELKHIVTTVQPFLTRAAVAVQERQRYWVLKLLNKRVGEELRALVLNTAFKGYNLLLLDYLLDVNLKTRKTDICPGDTVSVIIESAEPFAGTLKLRLAG